MSYPKSVIQAFEAWFAEEGAPYFLEKYNGTDFMLIVMDPGVQYDWRNPFDEDPLIQAWTNDAKASGLDGFKVNILNKLRFCLRTGLNSDQAHYQQGLVLPGDFPWAGAGWHRGILGGVSGLNEESDWWVFCRCVDKLLELQKAFIKPRIDASDEDKFPDRSIDAKYLLDEPATAVGSERITVSTHVSGQVGRMPGPGGMHIDPPPAGG